MCFPSYRTTSAQGANPALLKSFPKSPGNGYLSDPEHHKYLCYDDVCLCVCLASDQNPRGFGQSGLIICDLLCVASQKPFLKVAYIAKRNENIVLSPKEAHCQTRSIILPDSNSPWEGCYSGRIGAVAVPPNFRPPTF